MGQFSVRPLRGNDTLVFIKGEKVLDSCETTGLSTMSAQTYRNTSSSLKLVLNDSE